MFVHIRAPGNGSLTRVLVAKILTWKRGGSIAQFLVYLLPDPTARGFIPSKKISEEKIIDVAEVNQWRWVEESEQWVENVDQTHQVVADIDLAFLATLCHVSFTGSLYIPVVW